MIQELDGGIVLMLAFMSARRSEKGVKFCKSVVREMRGGLGMSEGAIPLQASPGMIAARKALDGLCTRCGRCEFGRKGA